MKPRHTHLPEDCRAVSDVLARIGDKWSVLVVTLLRASQEQLLEDVAEREPVSVSTGADLPEVA